MKVFAFVISLVLFVGGLALFGYAFDFAPEWQAITFAGGILAVSISIALPFHVLDKVD